MTMMIKGSVMSHKLHQEVLNMFVHRFTGNHTPQWVKSDMPNGKPYPLQFKDDADWLNNTFFAVTKKGELSRRNSYCESHPTWPNNPELRK